MNVRSPAQSQSSPNPYAPPKARLADMPQGEGGYFSVGLAKLAIMSFLTFGIYEIYWFYRNWKRTKELSGDKMTPVLRAIFFGFTAYFLFKRMAAHSEQHGEPLKAFGALALAVLILNMTWRLPDPFWMISYGAFLPLLPVQATVNKVTVKIAPDTDPNRRFTAWNVVGALLGGALLVLGIVGVFLQPAP